MREGHSTSKCHSIGVDKNKRDKQKSSNKKSREKKKGKEKAHNTTDGGGGDSDSDNEDPHHVKFEKCLMTSTVNFSDYSLSDGKSVTSPNNPEAKAYSACTAANLPAIIIDSSTTSHINSDRADFKSIKSSSSGSINGFGDSSRSIQGCEAQLYAQLPTSGQSLLK